MSRFDSILEIEEPFLRFSLFLEERKLFSFYQEKCTAFSGFDKNGFLDSEEIFNALRELMRTYKEMTRSSLKHCTIVLPGMFYTFGESSGSVKVNRYVTRADMDRLHKLCADHTGMKPTELLPQYYASDEMPFLNNPEGQACARLTLAGSYGVLDAKAKELFDNCAKRTGMKFSYLSSGNCIAQFIEQNTAKAEYKQIISFEKFHTDVFFVRYGGVVNATSVPWGEAHLLFALEDLGVLREDCPAILSKINLNVAFTDKDKYHVASNIYSMKSINTRLVETTRFIIGEIKKAVAECQNGDVPTYLLGTEVCQRRGFRELFEDDLNCEIHIPDLPVPNLGGCEDIKRKAFLAKLNGQ